MDSPTGIIPEELFDKARIGDVLRFLMSVPAPGYMKVHWLEGWAVSVGFRCSGKQREDVRRSGIDGM